jgi:heme/copper-type cytochrome/quinol oxidase subunit 4
MFIPGIVVGFLLCLLLTMLIRLSLANWQTFTASAAIGFGIGLAFSVVAAVINFFVGFMDKQSQKIKSGST